MFIQGLPKPIRNTQAMPVSLTANEHRLFCVYGFKNLVVLNETPKAQYLCTI